MSINKLENKSIFYIIQNLWKLISKKRKLHIVFLFCLMFLSSLTEIFSLISVIPFLQVLLEPESIYRFPILINIIQFFGINNSDKFLLIVTVSFVLSTVFAAIIRLLNLWYNNVLAANIGSDFSSQAFKINLYKPYTFHLNTNSSNLISTITLEINKTTETIRSVLLLFTSSLIIIGLILGLVSINFKLAISSIIIFLGIYLAIGALSKKRLINNSKIIRRNNVKIIKALQEGLGSIRDVLIHNSQDTYLQIYRIADRSMRIKEAQSITLATFPKFSLEALGITLLSLLGYSLINENVTNPEIISLLGTLALAAQRMLPSMQVIYGSWANIKSNLAAVNNVINTISTSKFIYENISKTKKLMFTKEISFENISFKYSSDTSIILDSINLKIKKGEKVGIIGETGCGKSTFLDILMGLLEPSSGKIFVDNLCINQQNKPNLVNYWRNSIAHVPQDIYLLDATIAENIAFGIDIKEIDFEKVRTSAKKAKINDFIESKTLGYRTIVGERGISLSGGQIQRIAIARAIYKEAEILVMDEATSALDNNTEKLIISEINALNKDLTILMVAHRLSSLNGCDKIIEFTKGKICNLNK